MQRFRRPDLSAAAPADRTPPTLSGARSSWSRLLTAVVAIAASVLSLSAAQAQTSLSARADRLPANISAERMELPTTALPMVHATALGHLDGGTALHSMRLVLQPSAAQKQDLEQLLEDQQNPSSPSYHQWLTPAQFAARFGVTDHDLTVIEQWLQGQGFTVDGVNNAHTAVLFSGTSEQVESAFGTTMQRFSRAGQSFFANGTNLHLPAAFSGVVSGVANLNSYRLRGSFVPSPQPVSRDGSAVRPDFTASSGRQYLVPWDFRQIYDLNGLVTNYSGSGIKIAVAGQSAIDTSQVALFQTLTGQTAKAPTLTLVPGSGVSTLYSGDEGESEIDVEYAGGVAPGDTVNFVYVGNNQNSGVFDALLYAIDNKLAPIVSISYGACETAITASDLATVEFAFQQANAQGQTVIASSGDQDAATCDASETANGQFTTAIDGATVSYPASSPLVTGVGGTTLTDGGQPGYWSATNNSQGGSATGYIPEVAWNDTASAGNVSGTGGGRSAVFGKPSWQSAPGVPADGRRDVPDISFASSEYTHPYLYCSAEVNSAGAMKEACTSTGFTAAAGGTSFAAPSFAATLAILEQANGISGGLGNVNPLLYAAATKSPGSFHDVTQGNNYVPCAAGFPDCNNGVVGYAAGPGYDLVTGLGSLDAGSLQPLFKPSLTGTLAAATVELTLNPLAPAANTSFAINAAVSGSIATFPTGTVSFTVDGVAAGSAVKLSTGSSTVTPSASTTVTAGLAVGTHTIVATYSGDSVFAGGSATYTLVIPQPAVGSFTIAATPATLTVANGSSGVETINITSTGGFADIVNFDGGVSISGTNASSFGGCYSVARVPVAANATASTMLTIYTSATQCSSTGVQRMRVAGTAAPAVKHAENGGAPLQQRLALFAAGGLLFGCLGFRRARRLPVLLALLLMAGSLAVTGCGSGSTSLVTNPGTPTGSYTITVIGTASTNSKLTATTTFGLTLK